MVAARSHLETYWESRKDAYPKLAQAYADLGNIYERKSSILSIESPVEAAADAFTRSVEVCIECKNSFRALSI